MLRGKVALVLGASPLAQGIALAASRNDAIVVLASLAEKEASEVVSQARQELKRDVLIYQKCDIRVESELKSVVSAVIQKWKRVDVLFHVADFLEEKWETVQHLKAVMLATKACIPYMIKQKHGRVVICPSLVVSPTAVFPKYGDPPNPYTVSKVGLLSFIRAAATDLAQYSVTVNVVESGLLLTSPLNGDQKQFEEQIPMGRLGRVDEVALPAIFVASDGASYITGQWISVNGGLGLQRDPPPGASSAPAPAPIPTPTPASASPVTVSSPTPSASSSTSPLPHVEPQPHPFSGANNDNGCGNRTGNGNSSLTASNELERQLDCKPNKETAASGIPSHTGIS